MNCRYCGTPSSYILLDLGCAPIANTFLTQHDLQAPEIWLPLKVFVCEHCWLVQTQDCVRADHLFSADYAYFSAYSTSWLAHAERYVSDMVTRFGLHRGSHLVEVAANDGYLLQYVRARGIPCTGIEPTASTAAAARARGIEIVQEFFGAQLAARLAAEGRRADLMVANNVLAHVPDLEDFVAGFTTLLADNGVATFEFPHLLRLLSENQFDTIYHEHYSYLSLGTVERIFDAAGLAIFDVEELCTHGGSLRVYAQRADSGWHPVSERVHSLLGIERHAGLGSVAAYTGFQQRADRVKNDFLAFLLQMKREGRTVAAYGAAAKGNTLLNYAGVRPDLIGYVIDRNPAKLGRYLPGSRIPIVGEERLRETRPDCIVLLPWNLREELIEKLNYARTWGARFVTAVPQLSIF